MGAFHNGHLIFFKKNIYNKINYNQMNNSVIYY